MLDDGSQGWEGYKFSCPTRFDRLFRGITVARTAEWVSWGDDEDLTPEDDYGRLLERALAKIDKGVRPWWDSNPRSRP